MINKEDFKNPQAIYRTAPFWALNDALEEKELKRQINLFKEQGMGGAFLHPRAGLVQEYLSEDFFDAIDVCVEEMKRLGMYAWLYDEDRFPSGVAGGKVLKANVEFSQQYLCPNALGGYSIEQGCKEAKFDYESYVDVCNKDAICKFIELTHEKYYQRFEKYFGNVIPAIFTDEPYFRTSDGLPWTKDFDKKFFERYGYDLWQNIEDLFKDTKNAARTRFHYWDLISSLFVEAFSKTIFNWCAEKGIAYTGHFWEHEFPSPLFTGSVMPHYEFMQYPGIDMLFVADKNSPVQFGNDFIVKEASSVANQFGKERVLSETNGASGWGISLAFQKRATDWQLALGINLFCQHLSLYSMTGYRKRDFPQSFLDHQPWWYGYKIIGDYIGRMSYALSQGSYAAELLVLHPAYSTWVAFGGDKSAQRLKEIEGSVKGLVKSLNQLRIMFDLGDELILSKHAKVINDSLCLGKMAYKVVVVPEMYVIRKEVFGLLKDFLEAGGLIVCVGNTPYLLDGEREEELDIFFKRPEIIKTENKISTLSIVLDAVDIPKIILQEKGEADIKQIYGHIRRLGEYETVFLCNLDMKEKYELSMHLEKPYEVIKFDAETGEYSACAVINRHNSYCVNLSLNALQSALFRICKNVLVKPEEEVTEKTIVKVLCLKDWSIQLKDMNAINLQFCRASLDGNDYCPLGDVLRIDDELKDKLGVERGHIFMRQPWMYSEEEKNNLHILKAEYPFYIGEFSTGRIMTAVELPDKFSVFINNSKVEPSGEFYKDRAFQLYDIKGFVKKGENIIRIETKEYGVLTNLESVYVVGDFKLEQGAVCTQSSISTGNIVEQGYPYYSGTIEYTAEIVTDCDFSSAYLSFGSFYGVTATVKLNGEKIRTIGWPPYEVDLTGKLQKGINAVTIEIANSLQNLLGPFGLSENQNLVTPGSFYAENHQVFSPVGFDGEAAIYLKK